MKFLKALGAWRSILREKKQVFETHHFLGKTLKTIPGTIRKKNDMDDAWFFELTKHHSTIYDIGANIGFTALLAMLNNPERDYILVDPNPRALEKACANLLANGIGYKARYYSAFVGNSNQETVKFYTIGSGAAGSMYKSHAHSAAAINSYTTVPTVTLDYLYNFYEIKPTLVKIDVEGAELQVLEGANKIARETQCAFMIEMHRIDSITMEEAGNKVISWCNNLNYNCWYMKNKVLLEDGKPIATRGKCHLLLLPNTQEYPHYLKNIDQGAALPF